MEQRELSQSWWYLRIPQANKENILKLFSSLVGIKYLEEAEFHALREPFRVWRNGSQAIYY